MFRQFIELRNLKNSVFFWFKRFPYMWEKFLILYSYISFLCPFPLFYYSFIMFPSFYYLDKSYLYNTTWVYTLCYNPWKYILYCNNTIFCEISCKYNIEREKKYFFYDICWIFLTCWVFKLLPILRFKIFTARLHTGWKVIY